MPKKSEVTNKTERNTIPSVRTKKVCFFCENKKEPEFTDSVILRKFMSDRSRIMPAARTGVCSKHQRAVTREIKHARHLALLPFITRA